MKTDWIKELEKGENSKEFSQMVHDYYKLSTMRIMQFLRKKYSIPEEDIQTVVIAMFSRLLNEGCYSVGSNIREGYPISNMFSKQHLLNLCRVLNGEPLDQSKRKDTETNIKESLTKFKKFITENASDFYT